MTDLEIIVALLPWDANFQPRELDSSQEAHPAGFFLCINMCLSVCRRGAVETSGVRTRDPNTPTVLVLVLLLASASAILKSSDRCFPDFISVTGTSRHTPT